MKISKNQPNRSKTLSRELKPELWSENYGEYLFNFARGRMPDTESAKDIVQQTFMAAWKGRKSFRGDSAERTWLTTILRNKITDFYRTQSRRPQTIDVVSAAEEGNESVNWIETRQADRDTSEPDRIVRRSEFFDRVLAALNEIPAVAAEAFKMRVIEGQSVIEIAEVLGITTGSASTKICRAKQKLRNQLGVLAEQI